MILRQRYRILAGQGRTKQQATPKSQRHAAMTQGLSPRNKPRKTIRIKNRSEPIHPRLGIEAKHIAANIFIGLGSTTND